MPKIGHKASQEYIQAAIAELTATGQTEIRAIGQSAGNAILVSQALASLGYPRTSFGPLDMDMPVRIRVGEEWKDDPTRKHRVLGLIIVHTLPQTTSQR